jgi:ATP-dependent Clp protease proteolytic subunit ClpP (EC 3.4.21.92)
VSTVCVGDGGVVWRGVAGGRCQGKRFALPNAEIMLHQVAGGAEGVAADIEINARQILKIKEALNGIIAKHTGQKIEKITADTDRDFYLTAAEAKDYGDY